VDVNTGFQETCPPHRLSVSISRNRTKAAKFNYKAPYHLLCSLQEVDCLTTLPPLHPPSLRPNQEGSPKNSKYSPGHLHRAIYSQWANLLLARHFVDNIVCLVNSLQFCLHRDMVQGIVSSLVCAKEKNNLYTVYAYLAAMNRR
jgi:hypothetical protein